MSFPYTIALDYGTSLEELCDVTSAAGLNLNVTRAVDGTSAASHGTGAPVRHVSSARDFNALYIHLGSTSGVHGVTGNVVGDSDTQTLTNKTLTNPIINGATFSGGTISGTWTSTATIFAASAANTVPFTVQGFSGQSVDLLDIKNSGGAVVSSFSSTGRLQVASTSTGSPSVVVNGASGITADLNQWQVNGSTLSRITNAGAFSGPNAILTGTVVGTNVLALTGASGQTANILNVGAFTGGPIFSVDANGNAAIQPIYTGTTFPYLAVTAPATGSTSATILQLAATTGGNPLVVTNGNPLSSASATVQINSPTLHTSGNSTVDGLVVNMTGGGSVNALTTKTSGTNKFTVDQSGNVVAAGTIGANNFTPGVWTSYTPVAGGSITPGNATYVANWTLAGKMCTVSIVFNAGSTTTLANSSGATMTLPFTSVNRSGARWTGIASIIPTGTTSQGPSQFDIGPNASFGTITAWGTFPNMTSFNSTTVTSWNTSGIVRISVTYEIA